nr:hypothetical protein [Lachnospiraceae bacterium]
MKKKEIGGYIEFETFAGKLFHEKAIKLNCGRNCLRYVIRAKEIHRIWLPELLCHVIDTTCREEGCYVEHYKVDHDFLPILDDKIQDDWLYIVNYYGQLGNKEIVKLLKKNPNLIIDNTEAFFQRPVKGVDTFYSCRKFFGVSDGAYLYTDKILEEDFKIDESFERMRYLYGRYERSAEEFYSLYKENNERFESEQIKKMSLLTDNILHGINYNNVKNKRTVNFIYLNERLKKYNKLNLVNPKGPYMYPFMINDGANIRKKLIRKKIYVPTLW